MKIRIVLLAGLFGRTTETRLYRARMPLFAHAPRVMRSYLCSSAARHQPNYEAVRVQRWAMAMYW